MAQCCHAIADCFTTLSSKPLTHGPIVSVSGTVATIWARGTAAGAMRVRYWSEAEPAAVHVSIAQLDRALDGCSTWFFSGHGDCELGGEMVLAFSDGAPVKEGEAPMVQTVSVASLVAAKAAGLLVSDRKASSSSAAFLAAREALEAKSTPSKT